MTRTNPHAQVIAANLTACTITTHTPQHAAARQARIAEEAQLIERLAAVAGFSLEETAARLTAGASAAGALLKTTEVRTKDTAEA